MREVCYIQDPKTGRFLGSKPGCSHGSGELSEKLLEKVEKDKATIKRRVDAAAAGGKLEPRDSELKDKAEELGRDVNSGAMTSGEGLNELSKGRSYPLYAKAVNLIEQDLPFWSGIADKAGTDEVDTLMAGIIGAPVPGSFIFAKNTANEDAGVQKVSDNEPPKIPSGATKEQIDAHNKEMARIAKERHLPEQYKGQVKEGVYDEKMHTKCHGNECDTKASLYGHDFNNAETSSGSVHKDFGYTAAMPPFYVGKLDPKKPLYVEVTNKANGEKVIVIVDDKGPFPIRDKELKPKQGIYPPKGIDAHHESPARAIDLSPAAYAKIMKNPGDGVSNVTIKFLNPEDGARRYKEQSNWAAKHESEIKQKVHEVLCKNDRKYKATHNCQ